MKPFLRCSRELNYALFFWGSASIAAIFLSVGRSLHGIAAGQFYEQAAVVELTQAVLHAFGVQGFKQGRDRCVKTYFLGSAQRIAHVLELNAHACLGRKVAVGYETFVIESILNLPSEHEWTYIRKDGSRFPVLLSVTVLRGDGDEITGFMGMAVDISDRREREAALARAQVELQRRLNDLETANERIETEAARQVTLLEDLALARDEAQGKVAAAVSGLMFAPASARLVAAASDGLLRFWHLPQTPAATVLPDHDAPVIAVTASSSAPCTDSPLS